MRSLEYLVNDVGFEDVRREWRYHGYSGAGPLSKFLARAKEILDSVNTENLAVGKETISAKELFHEAEFEKQKREVLLLVI